MQQEPRTDNARNINKGLYPLLQQPRLLIAQQKHDPQQTADSSDQYNKEYDDPARILRLSQHPYLPWPHAKKDNPAEDDHAETETIPPDHDTRHTFHADRQKCYGNDSSNDKTEDQFIKRR